MTRYRQILLISVAGLLVSGAAQAQQRGELMRDTLSTLGLIEKEQPAINYHERPPLVMPPKLDGKPLPAPRPRAASPQWPKEPEVAQRERDEQERRAPRGSQMQGRYNDNNATASIDEMRSGRRAGAQIPTENERKPGDNSRDSFWLNPFELMKGVGQEKTEPSIAEPSRDMLTDPPTGYRKAPRKVVTTNSDPINNASREREEADPGVYLRSQGR
ncbi:hypothetical protein [Methylobacterium nigriterrae]|uniref:hypothetical protein n=1 Tax=Methylobacterium nigriterrae TaxID=3127512 RepID=UPI0030140020